MTTPPGPEGSTDFAGFIRDTLRLREPIPQAGADRLRDPVCLDLRRIDGKVGHATVKRFPLGQHLIDFTDA